jgi:cytochrome P450
MSEVTDGEATAAGFRLIAESSPVASVFELFDNLRSRYSLFRSDDRHRFWVLTQYEDIAGAFRDHETFSSDSVFLANPHLRAKWPPLLVGPPEHGEWRRLLSPLFSPRAVARMEGWITAKCSSLISELTPRGSCDFIVDFACQFSYSVFAKIMGLPAQDIPQLAHWESLIERPSEAPDAHDRTVPAALELADYLSALIKERRVKPRADIISALIGCRKNGKQISDEDILALSMMLCLPGFSTVAAQLGYTFWHLATHGNDRARIATSPEIIPSAVEEFLRIYPVGATGRKLAKDTQLRGCPMKSGEMVMLAIPAANRDPEVFPEAATAMLEREPSDHLTFGAGIHYCLGASLSRLQLRVALEQWHKFIPDYELANGAEVTEYRSQSFWINSLPLAWD